MSKSFTCKELGGICEQNFSGETLDEIMEKGMEHMKGDDAHMEHIKTLSEKTGETKEEWYERMKKEFDAKDED